jgi:sRNA-binding protein
LHNNDEPVGAGASCLIKGAPLAPENFVAVQAAIALLAEVFPKAYAIYEARRRPLAIGIHHDILASMGGAITPEELNSALRYYVGNSAYLRACRPGASRIDLDGEPVGEVSLQHAARAAARLAGRQLRRAARKATLAEPALQRHGLAALKELGRARKLQSLSPT